jgi:hypothetical protein
MTVATGLEEMITEEKLALSVIGSTARTPLVPPFPFPLTFLIVNEISGTATLPVRINLSSEG